MAISTNPLLAVPYLKYKQASKSLTLSGMDTGSCIVNDSATASITVTLPLAKPGTMFRFYVNAPFTIVVQPRPTDNIGNLAAGAAYTLAAIVGTDLVLTCIGDSIWAIGTGNQLTGPVTIAAPNGAVAALTVNGSASSALGALFVTTPATRITAFQSTNVAGGYIAFLNGSTNYGYIGAAGELITGGATNDLGITSVGSNGVNLGTSGVSRIQIAAGGAVTIIGSTDSVNYPLTVQQLSTSGAFTCFLQGLNTAGFSGLLSRGGANNSTDTAAAFQNAAGTPALTVYGDGGVVISSAPTGLSKGSGTIRVTAGIYSGEAANMIHSTTAWTNGSGALVGTLTNSPVTGNPTKWIAVDDAGTTRHIPAW